VPAPDLVACARVPPAAPLPSVPTSKLFDPLMPFTSNADVELKVVDVSGCKPGRMLNKVAHAPLLASPLYLLPPPSAPRTPHAMSGAPSAPPPTPPHPTPSLLQAKPLNVKVSAASQSRAQDGTPVIAPRASAVVTARVAGAGAGVEVTFIAVDKAVLDVLPYPLQVRWSLAGLRGPWGWVGFGGGRWGWWGLMWCAG